MIKLQTKAWTSPRGAVRLYVQNVAEVIGLDIDRYKSGNISGATLGGETISNADAGRMADARVWIDADGGAHVDNWTARAMSAETVAELVAQAWTAQNAPEPAPVGEPVAEVPAARVGRPPIGESISWKPGDALLAEVDAHAAAATITRADALRALVRSGLDAYASTTASRYRVEIQASNVDGSIWQTVHTETVEHDGTALDLAEITAANQNIAEGVRGESWRVWVYAGDDPNNMLAEAGPGIPRDDEPTPTRYSSRRDAIEQDILPALGQDGDDYDAEAICDEAYAWRINTNARGEELLGTGGFEQVVTDDEFWEIAARHERVGA